MVCSNHRGVGFRCVDIVLSEPKLTKIILGFIYLSKYIQVIIIDVKTLRGFHHSIVLYFVYSIQPTRNKAKQICVYPYQSHCVISSNS